MSLSRDLDADPEKVKRQIKALIEEHNKQVDAANNVLADAKKAGLSSPLTPNLELEAFKYDETKDLEDDEAIKALGEKLKAAADTLHKRKELIELHTKEAEKLTDKAKKAAAASKDDKGKEKEKDKEEKKKAASSSTSTLTASPTPAAGAGALPAAPPIPSSSSSSSSLTLPPISALDALKADIEAEVKNDLYYQIIKDAYDIEKAKKQNNEPHKSTIVNSWEALEQRLTELRYAADERSARDTNILINLELDNLKNVIRDPQVTQEIFADRIESIAWQFSKYKESIDRFEQFVHLIASRKDRIDSNEFTKQKKELAALKFDLELYKGWFVQQGRKAAADKIDKQISRLGEMLEILQNNKKGYAHVGEYSQSYIIDTAGKSPADIEKAITEKEKDIIKAAGYDASASAASSTSTLTVASTANTSPAHLHKSNLTENHFGAQKAGDKVTCRTTIAVLQDAAKKENQTYAVISQWATASETITRATIVNDPKKWREVMLAEATTLPSATDRHAAMKAVMEHIKNDLLNQLNKKFEGLGPAGKQKAEEMLEQLLHGNDPAAFGALGIRISPVYVRGGTDNQAEAVEGACRYLRIDYYDDREPGLKGKNRMNNVGHVAYRKDVEKHPDLYFKNGVKPFFLLKRQESAGLLDAPDQSEVGNRFKN